MVDHRPTVKRLKVGLLCCLLLLVSLCSQPLYWQGRRGAASASPTVPDKEFAARTQRAATARIRAGDRSGALQLSIQAATERPCTATFEMLETVSSRANHPQERSSYLKGMRWLASDKSGEFGRTLRFLGHLAHAEEVAGNVEKSLRIRKQIVEQYPNQADTGSHLLSISRLSQQRRDQETAQTYLKILVNGEYPAEYRSAGQVSLDALELGPG